jgi:DNA-binding XRE family transcriptional regulator
MESKQFSKIRTYLGMTQNQLAKLLCISPKALQSYEQGWRNIPAYAERQLLLLLSLNRSLYKKNKPCWDVLKCPKEWRENCTVWGLKNGEFCWFVNGTFCHGKAQVSWKKKIQLCQKCEVFKANVNSHL